MSGRNNKPDNDGPASAPSRLDQFGGETQGVRARKPKNADRSPGRNSC
ncbi:hypothetical protein [Cohnella caldifontis]|nr:hypothetical protein [Cohnella sp. YIM B05605]